jgi:hypothetical protein
MYRFVFVYRAHGKWNRQLSRFRYKMMVTDYLRILSMNSRCNYSHSNLFILCTLSVICSLPVQLLCLFDGYRLCPLSRLTSSGFQEPWTFSWRRTMDKEPGPCQNKHPAMKGDHPLQPRHLYRQQFNATRDTSNLPFFAPIYRGPLPTFPPPHATL